MKRLWAFFFLSLMVSLTLVLIVFSVREKSQDSLILQQSEVIASEAELTLRRFLSDVRYDAELINTIRTSNQISDQDQNKLFDGFLRKHPSLKSISILTPTGTITGVYPYAENQEAIGKVTQSAQSLLALPASRNFFVSKLKVFYQGGKGFGVYVRTGPGADWMGAMISTSELRARLIGSALAQKFRISLREAESQDDFFGAQDGLQATNTKLSSERSFEFENRKYFLSIHPKLSPQRLVSVAAPVAIALLLAGLSTLCFVWWSENNASKERLEELNKLLRLTIHDTSNSLTAIKGYLEIMKDEPDLVPVEKLSKHVSFIIDLLDQIKIMKQLSSKTQDWKVSEHSLLHIVLEVSDILSDRLKQKKLSLTYNPEQLVNVKLLVNRGLFAHSVIGNLLTNAIKFSPDSSNVQIAHHQEEKYHVIEITDQGKGISPEKIFNVKNRRPNTSSPGTRGEEGSGFGLMIVQQVIELHGGKLEFTHSAQGGTIARIFLPLPS